MELLIPSCFPYLKWHESEDAVENLYGRDGRNGVCLMGCRGMLFWDEMKVIEEPSSLASSWDAEWMMGFATFGVD